ncbi:MAG: hypothetical protein ABI583_12895 [Betaproteobacteria bacterium]
MPNASQLPPQVEQSVNAFVEAAKLAFGNELISAVMYGSAAEGRLRATSDVNTLLVLKRFDQVQADQMREPLRLAHATIQMNTMFLLESELPTAMEAFAAKFADIASRHRVLFGIDPFAAMEPSRNALVSKLKRVLLNLQLRLRERYVLLSLREEQIALVIADAAGPLRSSAATLLHLEGQPALAPKEALERVVSEMKDETLSDALQTISSAREDRQLDPGKAPTTLIGLIEMTRRLRERVELLR